MNNYFPISIERHNITSTIVIGSLILIELIGEEPVIKQKKDRVGVNNHGHSQGNNPIRYENERMVFYSTIFMIGRVRNPDCVDIDTKGPNCQMVNKHNLLTSAKAKKSSANFRPPLVECPRDEFP